MERLTEIVNGVVTYVGPECTYSVGLAAGEMSKKTVRKVMRKLAAYEDTGLEPEEIPTGLELANVYAAMHLLKQYQGLGTIDEFRAALRRTAEDDKAREEGRLVELPEVSEQDRHGMSDFLHDCFAEWIHDPSVGLYGMTSGEAALANAIMAALLCQEAEAALGGGGGG